MKRVVLVFWGLVLFQGFGPPSAGGSPRAGRGNENVTGPGGQASTRREVRPGNHGGVVVSTFGPDGLLLSTDAYADASEQVRHGDHCEFYPNGVLRLRETYNQSVLTQRQAFYPSGRKQLFEQFEGAELVIGRQFAESGAMVPYEPWQQEARFAGGPVGLLAYVNQRLRYPAAALAANAEGRVYVRLEIDTLGAVTRVVLGRSVHPALDAEALRVARELRFEQPARQGGRAVAGSLTVPVTFRLK